jgi:hypothetical protein
MSNINKFENMYKLIREVNLDESIKENEISELNTLWIRVKKEIKRIDEEINKKNLEIREKILSFIKSLNRPFNKEELFKLPFSHEIINKSLQKLLKTNKVHKIGRNLYSYKIFEKEPVINISPEIDNLRRKLNDKGINFLITGAGILQEYVNLIPKRIINLIYVARGSGEDAKILIEKTTNKNCFLNPDKKTIRNIIAHFDGELYILREVGESSLEYNVNGIATIEKALVDLYFEVTRKKITFSEAELAHIIEEILEKTKIDYTKLLRAASRRYIEYDFLQILNALNIRLPLQKSIEESKKSRVKKIIQYFR